MNPSLEKPLKPIPLPEVRAIQIDLLNALDAFCQKHNLRYCLAGGTLLGAIRHKGYIPWDDDIDLLMPRPDYERFLKTAPAALPAHCTLSALSNNKNHIFPYAKLFDNRTIITEKELPASSVFIDIFPMDGLPENIRASDAHFKKIKCIDILLCSTLRSSASSKKKAFIRKLIRPFCLLIGRRRLLLWLDKTIRRYSFESSVFVAACSGMNYGKRERIAKSAVTSFVNLPFEQGSYPAPVGHHEYLSNLYGDYMQLPPLEKRLSHEFEAFWK